MTTIGLAMVVTAMLLATAASAQDAGGGGFGGGDEASNYDGDLGWYDGSAFNSDIIEASDCSTGTPGCFQMNPSHSDDPIWVTEGPGTTIMYDTEGNPIAACSGMSCGDIVGDATPISADPPSGGGGCTTIYDVDGNYVETVGPGPYSITVGPQWWHDSGTWWGTKTHNYNLCGTYTGTTNNLVCGLQNCVNQTFGPLLADVQDIVNGGAPQLRTNPENTSVVNIRTWFWDDDTGAYFDPHVDLNTHGQAPVIVQVELTATHVIVDSVEEQFACEGAGMVWQPGLDSETWCSHVYRQPASGASPTELPHYNTSAFRRYQLSCNIVSTGGGGSASTPSPCEEQLFGPSTDLALVVEEVQALNRSGS